MNQTVPQWDLSVWNLQDHKRFNDVLTVILLTSWPASNISKTICSTNIAIIIHCGLSSHSDRRKKVKISVNNKYKFSSHVKTERVLTTKADKRGIKMSYRWWPIFLSDGTYWAGSWYICTIVLPSFNLYWNILVVAREERERRFVTFDWEGCWIFSYDQSCRALKRLSAHVQQSLPPPSSLLPLHLPPTPRHYCFLSCNCPAQPGDCNALDDTGLRMNIRKQNCNNCVTSCNISAAISSHLVPS